MVEQRVNLELQVVRISANLAYPHIATPRFPRSANAKHRVMLWKADIATCGHTSVTIALLDRVRHLRLWWSYHPELRYMRGADRITSKLRMEAEKKPDFSRRTEV
jgi:hypothetical protein